MTDENRGDVMVVNDAQPPVRYKSPARNEMRTT